MESESSVTISVPLESEEKEDGNADLTKKESLQNTNDFAEEAPRISASNAVKNEEENEESQVEKLTNEDSDPADSESVNSKDAPDAPIEDEEKTPSDVDVSVEEATGEDVKEEETTETLKNPEEIVTQKDSPEQKEAEGSPAKKEKLIESARKRKSADDLEDDFAKKSKIEGIEDEKIE